MHALGQALQRAHRRRHAAHLREELLRFTRRTVAHHHQPELRRRPGQVVVNEAQALVHRYQRRAGSAVAVAGTPKDHRTEGRHDRLRRRRHPEPTLPVALDPARTVVPALGPGSKELATQAVHGLAQPRLNRLEPPQTGPIEPDCDRSRRPGPPLRPPRPAARKDRWTRGWETATLGIAPDAGLYGVASYRISRCGAFPPTTPGCRQRDKIPPCSGRLSRNPDFGCLPQPGNIAKSMTCDCHARPTPRRARPRPGRPEEAWDDSDASQKCGSSYGSHSVSISNRQCQVATSCGTLAVAASFYGSSDDVKQLDYCNSELSPSCPIPVTVENCKSAWNASAANDTCSVTGYANTRPVAVDSGQCTMRARCRRWSTVFPGNPEISPQYSDFRGSVEQVEDLKNCYGALKTSC